MKRKFLEDLGLDADVVEKIMIESGKDTTALKAKVDDLTEQLNVKDTTKFLSGKKVYIQGANDVNTTGTVDMNNIQTNIQAGNDVDVIKIVGDDTKLNIQLGNATYESLSGGEKTRVNIALLLAQKSLASIIGNISCNIIILDEILGYCDIQAEENVINLLTSELDNLESIYMVSHKEIQIGYDKQLVVKKDKQGLSNVLNI